MQLSCLPVSLYPEFASGARTLGDWIRLAASLDLDGADLSVAHLPTEVQALDSLASEARDAGMAIPMIVTYSDFTHPDASERRRQQEEVRGYIDVAHRLGVPFLRTTAGQAHPGLSAEEGLSWASEGLLALVDEAGQAGVTLLYENHTRGSVWQYNDFTQPADRFLEVARRTRESELGILFDTANPLALNDDPMAILEAVFPRVRALHLSDIERAGEFRPVLLGTGITPIPQLLTRLIEGGFDGWVSVEEASFSGDEGIAAAIAYARRAWHAASS